MANESTANIQLGFTSAALKGDAAGMHLLGVHGQERISTLFEYELLLGRPGELLTDTQLEDIVSSPCAIALGPNVSDVVHGMIIEIEHLDTSRYVAPRYLAMMVPELHLLTMGKRSAVYQNMNVRMLVEQVLDSYGLASGTHFEVLGTDAQRSPQREYIVQYQESDWDFISRWLEREGYFYWFKHGKAGACLVIADANDDVTAIGDPQQISYREVNNIDSGGESTIFDFRVVQRRVPKKVTVVDYNYRHPAERLVHTEKVSDTGFGNVFTYDNHFKDAEAGKLVAKTRAERHLAIQRTVRGSTDCARFRVGHSFELENHHNSSYDGHYLITSIDIKVGHEVENARRPPTQGASEDQHRFTCAFEALPLGVAFRPERVTPWPRVPSFITGHIEADTNGEYAQIDKQGRYKVRMTFDTGTVRGLAASRWIRMSQSYAGAGYGEHYPLHKGTEVAIAHADGDPDRPVIIGATPNPLTKSPVTSSNATQSVIHTASGIRVELEDMQS
jgi:type VI secretion system secreted protein VgrG